MIIQVASRVRAVLVRGGRFGARRLIAGATAVLFGFLLWLGWTGTETRDALRTAAQRAVRVAELRGTIVSLDEVLTMAVQMAASSGKSRWVDRYDETNAKLDAALAEAANLATPDVRAALAWSTDEAHRDLVLMERRAMKLAADHDLEAAQRLLDGPEFAYLQDVYATGLEVFGRELQTLADTQAAALNDRAWSQATGLGLSVVLLVAAVLTVRGNARLKGAMALTAAVARIDALTDLPNRRHFYDDLAHALGGAGRDEPSYVLFLIDLDRFKAVNDAHGHPAGDHLLQLVATRLRANVRSGDLIARLGGDEFALLFHLDPGGQIAQSNDPAQVAKRIVAVLGEPFTLPDSVAVQIGASIGIAFVRPGSDEVGDLLHRADVALAQAKGEGRACYRFFEHGMDARVRSRALLEGDLRQAIENDAIVPHFQPLVDIKTGRIIGVEMLARWPHPTRGMVSPVEFIPLAENMGLIGAMTDRLMRQACVAASRWPAHLTLACNVSPLQLRDPGLPAMVRAVLDDTGFPASRLEVEVTESALVGDLALARALLDQLKGLGVRLALDDFGTGYSSLQHLQKLPFDKLKIDASFVAAMVTDEESGKIVSAVVKLGHSLGLSTVAEGVETAAMADLLRDFGCDVGQGWLFGRPVSAAAIDLLVCEPDDDEMPSAMVA